MYEMLEMKTSVANTLKETLAMVDSTPVSNDMAWSFHLPSYATKAFMLHNALEIGMKGLKACEGDSIDKGCVDKFGRKYGHSLAKVNKDLAAPVQDKLSEAFEDIVQFFHVRTDVDNFSHMVDFHTYLEDTDTERGDVFTMLRYWSLYGDPKRVSNKRLPDLSIMREMIRFIADLLLGYGSGVGGPFYISQRVEQSIRGVILSTFGISISGFGRIGEDSEGIARYNEDKDSWRYDYWWLRELRRSHGSYLNVLRYAYENDFDILNTWTNEVLKNSYETLRNNKIPHEDAVRPALDYVFSTFGANSSECPDIPSALVEVEDRNPNTILVKSPSSHILGFASERPNGLWYAKPSWGKSRLARDMSSAIGILIESFTSVLSISVNGSPFRDCRVRVDDGFFDDVTIDFWFDDHGIKTGDELRAIWPYNTSGKEIVGATAKVRSVNGHIVTLARDPITLDGGWAILHTKDYWDA